MTETEKPDTTDHDDEIDGLDFPVGKPLLAAYKQGLDDGYDQGKDQVKEVSRANWWEGFACGCLMSAAAVSVLQHLIQH